MCFTLNVCELGNFMCGAIKKKSLFLCSYRLLTFSLCLCLTYSSHTACRTWVMTTFRNGAVLVSALNHILKELSQSPPQSRASHMAGRGYMRVYAFIQVKVQQFRHHVPQFRQPGKPREENQEGKLSCQHALAIHMNGKWMAAKCNELVHFRVQIPNSVTFWKKCQNHALWKYTVPVWNEGSFWSPAVAITAGCEQTGDLNSVHIFKVITTIIIPQIQTQ